MTEYPKINAPFHRDMAKPGAPLIVGRWSEPEFEYLKDNEWEWTEKVDGTNIRVELRYREEDVMGYPYNPPRLSVFYKGRTDNANIPPHLMAYLEETFPSSDGLRHVGIKQWMIDNGLADVTLYGEGYGPKIQGGGKYREDASFVLFDVRIGDFWLSRENVNDVGQKLGVDTVPVVGYGTLRDAVGIVSAGLSSMWGEFEAEGLVVRPTVPLFNRKGHRITTKIKARDFK